MAIEFTYDGTVKAITATKDCTVTFTLQGGGGAGAGNDQLNNDRGPSYGSAGLPGSIVDGSVFLKAGETVYCAVGGKGFPGSTTPGSSGSAGGSGGYGLDGFSGGAGGRAGNSGWSGGGGGGGAATVLYKVVNGQRQYIAVAAGGGGGGGGGNHSAGYINSYSPYAATPGEQTYVTSYERINADWWINGIHVRTGGYMGDADPRNGVDSSGWRIREIIVYINGSAVSTSYDNWWNGTSVTLDSSYTNLSKVAESYLYGDEWAGGGDYWAIYSFTRPIQVLSNLSAFITRGGKGKNHPGDGGGPGGGGGGYPGGQGGIPPGGDYGAMSGSIGYSINYGESSSGTGARSSSFINNGSAGGAGGGSAYDGYAAFNSTQVDLNIKNVDGWQKPASVHYMQNGSWTSVKEIYYRQNNDWVRVYGDNIPDYTSQAATFNNTSGPAVA